MTLQFDDRDHSAEYGEQRIVLPPLSFRLLRILAANGDTPVSTDRLIASVWQDVSVSPDTLKQRVFLLRKSLEDAGWHQLQVIAIRGEGYRLTVPEPDGVAPETNQKNTVPSWRGLRRPKVQVMAAVGLLLLMVAVILWGRSAPPVPVSNRVAFWISPDGVASAPAVAALRAAWRERLQASANRGQIQLMQNELASGDPIPVAARRGRVALVSLMEPNPDGRGTQVRLSIIEPTTATILRSDLLDPADRAGAGLLLDQQLLAVEVLVSSGLLALTKAQKDDATDPVWARLREIATAR